jgi:hypothetical protein
MFLNKRVINVFVYIVNGMSMEIESFLVEDV